MHFEFLLSCGIINTISNEGGKLHGWQGLIIFSSAACTQNAYSIANTFCCGGIKYGSIAKQKIQSSEQILWYDAKAI